MTSSTKSAERRKAGRQVRSLRICWRALGNRHLRFGQADLKDIGTQGLALQVDQDCPKGTVVIVQFEAAACFAEPMLLRAEWSREVHPTSGGTKTYLLGCSFTSPFSEKDLQALMASVKDAPAAPALSTGAPPAAGSDPFLMVSASEKRSLARRGGLTVPVTLCRAAGSPLVEASVVDRSLQGLGIVIHRPFTRGTLLKVRPRHAPEKMPSVQVEVRNCRHKGKQWLLGCRFLEAPPANVLILLG
jgi:hypothetical protein